MTQPGTFEDIFAFVVASLDEAKVPYMVARSFASTYHGIPRTTQDLHMVVDLEQKSLDDLLARFAGANFYVSPEAAKDAVETQGQFNVIDAASGWKLDLICKKQRPFSICEFERRHKVTMFETVTFVATAEDTIISKLEWAKDSLSERQLRDVAGIVDVQGEALDRDYLAKWIAELGLTEVYAAVRGPW